MTDHDRDTSKGAPDAKPGEHDAEREAWERAREHTNKRLKEAFDAEQAKRDASKKGGASGKP